MGLMPTFKYGSNNYFESNVPVLFIWKGKTLTTAHAKGYAASAFPRSTESSDEAAVRALQLVLESLEDSKAENIVTIDIAGKSALGDFMVVVSGRSNRHVMAIADHLITDLKDDGLGRARVEGLEGGDWVLIDTGDVIVHIFRPEIRAFYNIEKMWAAPEIEDGTLH
jgi:ribosome-associated protein